MIKNYKGSRALLKSENQKSESERSDKFENLHAMNAASGSQIAQLQDAGDTYSKKIEIEKKKIKELEKQNNLLLEKIKEQRKEFHGTSGAKENNEAIAKKIKSLENKLDKALQKYNITVAANKQLREQIDTLRREKIVYENIHKKLEQELAAKNAQFQKIKEQGAETDLQIQKVKNDIAKLKQEAESDQQGFEKQWNQLGKLIEQDNKMKEFIKSRDPATQSQQLQSIGLEEEQQLKNKIGKTIGGFSKDKASIHESMQKVQIYEEAFAKIQAATGISDIDELVKKFVEAEKQNFSLFNYVNELSNELERLEQQISDLKEEIERYKGKDESTDNQRMKIMQELEEKLQKTDQKSEMYDQKLKKTQKIINSLKVGVQSIFDRIGCNTETVQEMLGFSGVTETNLMQYLGIIEQRTNEILQMYSTCQEQNIDTARLFNNQQNAQAAEKQKIEIPEMSDGEEQADEENITPLNIEQFNLKAQHQIEKKQDRNAKKANIKLK